MMIAIHLSIEMGIVGEDFGSIDLLLTVLWRELASFLDGGMN